MRVGRQGIVIAGTFMITMVVLLVGSAVDRIDVTPSVPLTAAQSAGEEGDVKYVLPDPLFFETIEEAQSVVPYPIKVPESIGKSQLQRVVVRVTPTRDLGRDLVTVDVTFTNAEGDLIRMALNNGPTIPWGENQPRDAVLEHGAPTDALGASAVTKTLREDGKVQGYVYWQVGDVVYQLFYPGLTGRELVSVAAQTVIDSGS